MKKIFFALIALGFTIPFHAQPPDYDLPQNWMCHPVLKTTDASKLSLQLDIINPDLSIDTTIQYAHASNTGTDIFYIYPTIDNSLSPANVAINNIDTNYAKYVFRIQAGEYAQFGRVFVPYYRQATYGTYVFSGNLNQSKLLDTAYTDVEAAFLNYLNNYNNGNRIILIGHSQGAGHVGFLLRKLFDNNAALQSKLVVALMGGMSNYVNKGSKTGGLLQNIPVCPPRDSGYACGCTMAWRNYQYGTAIPSTYGNSQPLNNPFITALGLQYSTFDTLTQETAYYDFGYTSYKNLTRYITLNAQDSTTYVGYDSAMFSAQYTEANASSEALMVENTQQPGDQRVCPIPSSTTNYHIYDMQIVQGDLINIIRDMIAFCMPSGMNEKSSEAELEIYPNPGHGIIQVRNRKNKMHRIDIYNMLGRLIYQSAVNDKEGMINLAEISAGIYFMQVKTENGVLSEKIIITR